jgi:DNA polymerase-3 subunit beta
MTNANFSALIERNALKLALDRCHLVTERRNTVPIYSYVSLQVAPGAVTLRATDMDMELSVSVAADVGEAWAGRSVCVPLATLRDFVARADKGALVMMSETLAPVPASYDAAGNPIKGKESQAGKMTLEAGRARASVPIVAGDDLPRLPAAAGVPVVLALDLARLAHDLNRVRGAVSTEETRYYLNGAYMHRAATGGLVMAATDGYRLVTVTRPDIDAPEALPAVIIPRKALAVFSALAGKKAAGDVEMTVTAARVTIAGDSWTLDSKTVDGVFPDYTRVIPPRDHPAFMVDAAALAPAVKRVASISAGRLKSVCFDVAGDKLTISATCPENGVAVEESPIAGEGAAYAVGFNSAYLGDMLALAGPDKLVRFAGQDPAAPFHVEFPGAPELLAVLMPMRVGPGEVIKPPRVESVAPADVAETPEAAPAEPEAPAAATMPQPMPEAAGGHPDTPEADIEAPADVAPDDAAPIVADDTAPAADVAPEAEAAPMIESPEAPAAAPAPDLAAIVAALVEQVAALHGRLDAMPGDVAAIDAAPVAAAPDVECPAIDWQARALAAEKDAADWQAIAEQNKAHVDRARAERDKALSDVDWFYASRSATAARIRALRATSRELEAMNAAAIERASAAALDAGEAWRARLADQATTESLGAELAKLRRLSPLGNIHYLNAKVGRERFGNAA